MRQLRFDFGVGVDDNCDEHVHEDEEHEEDKEHKIRRTENTIRLLQVVKIEITEQDTKLTESVNISSHILFTCLPLHLCTITVLSCRQCVSYIVVLYGISRQCPLDKIPWTTTHRQSRLNITRQ